MFMSVEEPTSISLAVIIPAVMVPVAIIFLCCVVWISVILIVFRREYRVKSKEHQDLTSEMNQLKKSTVPKTPFKFGLLHNLKH